MSGYIGVGGKARKVKRMYVGVDGKAKRVVKAYVGDESGKARLWYETEPTTVTVRHKLLSKTGEDITAENPGNTLGLVKIIYDNKEERGQIKFVTSDASNGKSFSVQVGDVWTSAVVMANPWTNAIEPLPQLERVEYAGATGSDTVSGNTATIRFTVAEGANHVTFIFREAAS